ncbi:hypothetical protein YSA_09787 [Pseudomonas putida ND6]|uniref:Uncharacterized protein n=1 Tax=Pseudomonas putida ND6 TaxID=231023 RepID=I3V2W2_PSEPU|nr:hypothetical protein YSA_09787 [Pseudomonas putida ND6]
MPINIFFIYNDIEITRSSFNACRTTSLLISCTTANSVDAQRETCRALRPGHEYTAFSQS